MNIFTCYYFACIVNPFSRHLKLSFPVLFFYPYPFLDLSLLLFHWAIHMYDLLLTVRRSIPLTKIAQDRHQLSVMIITSQ